MSSLPRPNIATVDYELLVEYRREMAKRARKPLDLDPQDYFAEAENEKMSKSIDGIRDCGAGQDLDLPQLVVIGKPSAGTASLVQSLMGLPFPLNGGLCTQFALRVVSRRTAAGSHNKAHASIEPSDFIINRFANRGNEHQTKDFAREISPFTAESFEELVKDAKVAMGLASQGSSEDRRFSNKVLKIELSGPDRSRFGLLDLSGIFSAEIGCISKGEKAYVMNMMSIYMSRPYNIIVYVADASEDTSNETILPLARHIESSPIVGVISNCDRAQSPIDIVRHITKPDEPFGKPRQWHVVQNCKHRAEGHFNWEQEDQIFFSKAPWTDVPQEWRGTATLKRHLASLLCQRIRDVFPRILETIRERLDSEKQDRKNMGDPLAGPLQIRPYLLRIVDTYRALALQALKSPADLQDDKMNLRNIVVKENQKFERQMKDSGHIHDFTQITEDSNAVQQIENRRKMNFNVCADSTAGNTRLGRSMDTPTPAGSAIRRCGLYTPSQSPPRKATEPGLPQSQNTPLYSEIRHQISLNRGDELPGMLNPSVLKPLFVKQSSKWLQIAEDYLTRIMNSTAWVSFRIFYKVCRDARATDRIITELANKISARVNSSRDRVIAQLKELCDRNENLPLQTDTEEFLHAVCRARIARFKAALNRYKTSFPASSFMPEGVRLAPESDENWAMVPMSDIHGAFDEIHPQGNRSQNVEDEAHDLLKAYYDLALKNFIYDIRHNIVEPFLHDRAGPLLCLSTELVSGLTEAEGEYLAGEDEGVDVKRREADDRIERLEAAKRIVRDPLDD